MYPVLSGAPRSNRNDPSVQLRQKNALGACHGASWQKYIVLEPKQPCEQKIIEARLHEAFQFGPSLSKRHGSEEQRESGEDLAGLL